MVSFLATTCGFAAKIQFFYYVVICETVLMGCSHLIKSVNIGNIQCNRKWLTNQLYNSLTVAMLSVLVAYHTIDLCYLFSLF